MVKKRSTRQNDVCRQLDIQPYVLRYWETEFPFLKSSKASGAQRTFSAEEVALLGRIRTLLYDEGYTIAGARKRIEAEQSGGAPVLAESAVNAAGQPQGSAVSGRATSGAGAKRAEAAAAEKARAEHEQARLRTGVEDALSQARTLLALLEST